MRSTRCPAGGQGNYKMKVLTVHGPNDYRMDPFSMPTAGAHDAVIKISACGICGSDLSYIKWGTAGPNSVQPTPLGHEASGTIVQLGSSVSGFAVGDRVIVNPMTKSGVIGNGASEGAFAPYLLVKDVTEGNVLHHMPPGVSFETAALVEPLAVSMHAVNRSNAAPGERAVVFGVGPIGLGVVIWLRQRGLTDIVAVDLSAERLALASRLGASHVIRPDREDVASRLRELHGETALIGRAGAGSDLYFDVAGTPAIIPQIINMARLGARLVVVAVYGQPVPIDFLAMLMCELSITMSMGYPKEFPLVVAALRELGDEVNGMITDRFSFQNILPAFERAFRPGAGKIMVAMAEDS